MLLKWSHDLPGKSNLDIGYNHLCGFSEKVVQSAGVIKMKLTMFELEIKILFTMV